MPHLLCAVRIRKKGSRQPLVARRQCHVGRILNTGAQSTLLVAPIRLKTSLLDLTCENRKGDDASYCRPKDSSRHSLPRSDRFVSLQRRLCVNSAKKHTCRRGLSRQSGDLGSTADVREFPSDMRLSGNTTLTKLFSPYRETPRMRGFRVTTGPVYAAIGQAELDNEQTIRFGLGFFRPRSCRV